MTDGFSARIVPSKVRLTEEENCNLLLVAYTVYFEINIHVNRKRTHKMDLNMDLAKNGKQLAGRENN